VRKEENYPYSSAPAHIKGIKDEILGKELFDEEERKDYIEFIKREPSQEESGKIRKAYKTGRPLGDDDFINRISKLLESDFKIK
jgi:putative transposase